MFVHIFSIFGAFGVKSVNIYFFQTRRQTVRHMIETTALEVNPQFFCKHPLKLAVLLLGIFGLLYLLYMSPVSSCPNRPANFRPLTVALRNRKPLYTFQLGFSLQL